MVLEKILKFYIFLKFYNCSSKFSGAVYVCVFVSVNVGKGAPIKMKVQFNFFLYFIIINFFVYQMNSYLNWFWIFVIWEMMQ